MNVVEENQTFKLDNACSNVSSFPFPINVKSKSVITTIFGGNVNNEFVDKFDCNFINKLCPYLDILVTDDDILFVFSVAFVVLFFLSIFLSLLILVFVGMLLPEEYLIAKLVNNIIRKQTTNE